jgi:Subtilase family
MAAAVVAGAAARVMAARPRLSAQRVRTLLEATARDVPPGGVDSASGAGALDLDAALAAAAPPPEDPEPNDDTVQAARTRVLLAASAASASVTGRTGSWADRRDGFRVVLRAGETVTARLEPLEPTSADLDLALWRPGTPAGERGSAFARTWLVAASLRPGTEEELAATAAASGVYTLEVQGLRSATAYRLSVHRSVTAAAQD